MILDSKLETTPVLYGNSPVKLLTISSSTNSRCIPLHWHNRFEMLVIQRGSLKAYVSGVEVTAKKGDIVIINPGATHQACTLEDGAEYRVIMFELGDLILGNKLAERTLRPFATKTAAFLPLMSDQEILAITNKIYSVSENAFSGSELVLTGLVYEMLGILVAKYIDTDYINPVREERFKDILDYISANYCSNITSSSISKKFGYDNTYFGRKFKEITGLSPTQYIRVLRLEKARKMLIVNDRSVSEIALTCGFTDLNYFSRCFKSHYNLSAVDYRKRNK